MITDERLKKLADLPALVGIKSEETQMAQEILALRQEVRELHKEIQECHQGHDALLKSDNDLFDEYVDWRGMARQLRDELLLTLESEFSPAPWPDTGKLAIDQYDVLVEKYKRGK